MTIGSGHYAATSGMGIAMPEWVPVEARHYLSHVEMGRPIRALARSSHCHASTILRQIRKLETLRDDPLVDDALETLGRASRDRTAMKKETPQMIQPEIQGMPDDETLAREARRILRRLCETGAVLAIAADMEKAVVVRDGPDGATTRTGVVDRPVAQAMASHRPTLIMLRLEPRVPCCSLLLRLPPAARAVVQRRSPMLLCWMALSTPTRRLTTWT